MGDRRKPKYTININHGIEFREFSQIVNVRLGGEDSLFVKERLPCKNDWTKRVEI
jgi:hypothetical protein